MLSAKSPSSRLLNPFFLNEFLNRNSGMGKDQLSDSELRLYYSVPSLDIYLSHTSNNNNSNMNTYYISVTELSTL